MNNIFNIVTIILDNNIWTLNLCVQQTRNAIFNF